LAAAAVVDVDLEVMIETHPAEVVAARDPDRTLGNFQTDRTLDTEVQVGQGLDGRGHFV
jgi:hypothetical protein